MNQPYYPFEVSTNRLSFIFESINNGRKITKAVEYIPFHFDKTIYNLAFGDIDEKGELDDLSVSDNQDMEKVLATVIQTIFVFLERILTRHCFLQVLPMHVHAFIEELLGE